MNAGKNERCQQHCYSLCWELPDHAQSFDFPSQLFIVTK